MLFALNVQRPDWQCKQFFFSAKVKDWRIGVRVRDRVGFPMNLSEGRA
jgi:hypothetical protein